MRAAMFPPGAALALALAAAACGGRESAEARPSGEDRVLPVQTAAAELGTVARTATVSGAVEPLRRVFVNSQMSSEVVAVRVEEGDAVRGGSVLARLDDRQLQAQLASAEASYEVAEAAYLRAEQLREGEVITQAEYDQERTAYAAAKARLEQLRTQLEFTVIRAPVSGVVTERAVELGNVVSPQTRLFTIDDISTMVVRVRVSELDVVHLRSGTEVRVVLDAFPDRPLSGRIRRVFPSADPATRLVPVEVAFEGEGARLARPGFLARVTFRLEGREGVVLVPSVATLAQGGREAVFVVEGGRAYRRPVTTGLVAEGRVEVRDGLEAGELVVVQGQTGLRDVASVRIVSAGSPLEDLGSPDGAGPEAGSPTGSEEGG